MLRGVDVGRAAALVDKVKPALPKAPRSARPAAVLGPALRGKPTPFSNAALRSVRVDAASGGAERAAGGRGPRVARTVTVQLDNLKPGEELEGKVTKVETFGCFVDIGARTDGLVHISQLGGGFVKSVGDVVSVGQIVKCKVLSVDTANGRLALTLKGTSSAAGGAAALKKDDNDVDEEEEEAEELGDVQAFDASEEIGEEEMEEEEEVGDELADYEVPEGQEAVFPDELAESFFLTPSGDGEVTTEALADYEANEDQYQYQFEQYSDSVPLPLYERVTGKVTRVETYGAFVSFEAPGSNKPLEGLLHISEMKAPAVALSEEELEQYEPQDATAVDGLFDDYSHNEYVDVGEIDDATRYYKVGDEVTAFFIGTSDPTANSAGGGINLSQFTDAELLGAGIDVTPDEEEDVMDDGEFEVDEDIAKDFGDDALSAIDPVRILDEDDTADLTPEEAAKALGGPDRRSSRPSRSDEGEPDVPGDEEELMGNALDNGRSNVLIANSLLFKDQRLFVGQFPSRPVSRSAAAAAAPSLSTLALQEEDFDLDTSDLQDYWTHILTGPVPKGAMKKAGYKLDIDANGDPVEVKREGEVPEEALWDFTLSGDVNDRAKEFLKDLLDDDEDEAELPARAYRRPHVLAAAVTEGISAATVKQLRQKTGAGMMDCKKALTECAGNMDEASEWLRKKGLAGADKKAGRIAAEGAIARYIHPGARLGVLLEVNCETDFVAAGEAFQRLVSELGMVVASSPDVTVVSTEDISPEMMAKERDVEMGREDLKTKPEAVRAKIVEGRLEKMKTTMALMNQPSLRDNNKTVSDIVKETVAAVGENIKVRRFVRFSLGEGLQKRSNDFAAEVAQQTQARADKPKPAAAPPAPAAVPKAGSTVQVSASAVKELRQSTGAGMMDCKRALAENNNDTGAATEWLRKKGLAGADKKSGRLAAEGNIAAYIHPGSRLGVLLEVNCETDFVGASDKFQQLVNGIAMQIAASPQVQFVSADEIPAEIMERERQIELGREDLKGKPDAIKVKIAEGRAKKIAQEMALLEQPFLMDTSKTVGEAVKEAIAAIGEKISVRRFIKFQLGEGLEKRSTDFAAEVAAATGQKA